MAAAASSSPLGAVGAARPSLNWQVQAAPRTHARQLKHLWGWRLAQQARASEEPGSLPPGSAGTSKAVRRQPSPTTARALAAAAGPLPAIAATCSLTELAPSPAPPSPPLEGRQGAAREQHPGGLLPAPLAAHPGTSPLRNTLSGCCAHGGEGGRGMGGMGGQGRGWCLGTGAWRGAVPARCIRHHRMHAPLALWSARLRPHPTSPLSPCLPAWASRCSLDCSTQPPPPRSPACTPAPAKALTAAAARLQRLQQWERRCMRHFLRRSARLQALLPAWTQR